MFYMFKGVNSIAEIKITQIQKLQKTWKSKQWNKAKKSWNWFWTTKLEYFMSICELSVDF